MKFPSMNLASDRPSRRTFGQTLAATVFALPLFGSLGLRTEADEPAATLGAPLSPKSRLLGTAAKIVQPKRPIDAMSDYLNGFHFYADDMGRQIEAHHYCTHLSEDFHQCVIYDGDSHDAKLIGVEYILSARIFAQLPAQEKKLWHSHVYEVKSGQLVARGVPEAPEHALMEDLVSTYGKTWHTWQIDRDPSIPLGIPQLMMGFTKDGQTNQSMLDGRDKRIAYSTAERKQNRSDIAVPGIDPLANAWRSGKSMQLKLDARSVRNARA